MPKFRRVTGLFRAAMPDGPDTDYTPELEALNGQIEFVPRYRGGVIAYPRLDPPEFVRPEPIQAVLQDGRVMTQVTAGEETVIQPVELMVSDDDEAAQSWQWEAVFRDIRVGRWGDEITISPLRFTVPDEHGPLDLTEVVGEKSGGTITVKGPRGEGLTDIRAENGELIVEWGADKRLVIPVPDAIPGPTGPRGPQGPAGTVELVGGAATITVDTSVGTRVMIGNRMVYGDTGWRDVSSYLRDDFTWEGVRIRRYGDVVTWRINGLTASAPGLADVGQIPMGFRPPATVAAPLVTDQSGSVSTARFFTSTINVRPAGVQMQVGMWAEVSYVTDQSWPSTLPGTAV